MYCNRGASWKPTIKQELFSAESTESRNLYSKLSRHDFRYPLWIANLESFDKEIPVFEARWPLGLSAIWTIATSIAEVMSTDLSNLLNNFFRNALWIFAHELMAAVGWSDARDYQFPSQFLQLSFYSLCLFQWLTTNLFFDNQRTCRPRTFACHSYHFP